MRRVIRIAFAFALIGAVSTPTPAAAGGGNWLEFDETYNLPGAEITVNAEFSTTNAHAMKARAPYYVYLDRMDPELGWGLPQADAKDVRRVGVVDVWWPGTLESETVYGHMTSTFTLPELPVGQYLISICDAECVRLPGGGQGGPHVTGDFWIVGTAAEAKARERLDEVRQSFQMFRYRDQIRDRRELKGYKTQIEDLRAERVRDRSALTEALVSAEGLRHDLAAAQDELGSTRVQRDVGLGALVLLVGAWFALRWWSRRRTAEQFVLASVVPPDERATG